jgi:hypothetical protein
MVSRLQRDKWTDFVRRSAADLQHRVVGFVLRLWGPTVRWWFRACTWTALGCFGAITFACFAMATRYEVRKHDVVPANHRVEYFDGQPAVVRRSARPAEDRPRTPLTAEQLQAYQEDAAAGQRWARRGALCFAPVVLLVLLLRPWQEKPASPA